jgi:cellulose biosynthesis protein BcsQ
VILSLVQTKGGTGKTTIARGLAYSKAFQKHFKSSICLIELDQQGSLSAWHKQRQESGFKDKISFMNLARAEIKELENKLITLSSQNELIILDVAGESVGRFMTKFAIALSDIVLFPMRSSADDEQSFRDNLYPIIQENFSSDSKSNVYHIIPTFVHPQTKLETIKSYFEEIKPDEVQCLNAFLPYRGVFENYSRNGMNQYEYAKLVENNARQHGQALKAISDIEVIAKSIITIQC